MAVSAHLHLLVPNFALADSSLALLRGVLIRIESSWGVMYDSEWATHTLMPTHTLKPTCALLPACPLCHHACLCLLTPVHT